MLDFVKLMYAGGCPIEGYLAAGAITSDEYKQITGKDYAAGANA